MKFLLMEIGRKKKTIKMVKNTKTKANTGVKNTFIRYNILDVQGREEMSEENGTDLAIKHKSFFKWERKFFSEKHSQYLL